MQQTLITLNEQRVLKTEANEYSLLKILYFTLLHTINYFYF